MARGAAKTSGSGSGNGSNNARQPTKWVEDAQDVDFDTLKSGEWDLLSVSRHPSSRNSGLVPKGLLKMTTGNMIVVSWRIPGSLRCGVVCN